MAETMVASHLTSRNSGGIELTRLERSENPGSLEEHSEIGAGAASQETRVSPELEQPTKKYQTLLLLSGFIMCFQVIGINQTYGIFQEFYASEHTNIKDAQDQDAFISLIGAIGSGLTWSGSIFVNPMIARADDLQRITVPGVLIMSLGLVLASFATRLWHLFLTQALMYGVGSSMYYFPIMSITPIYFDRHRGFAMGFILAGSGIGGLAISPILSTMIEKLGLPWALRILGLWTLLLGIPTACVVKHRPGYGIRGRTRLNMGLARRGTFLYQAGAAFLQAAGNVIPLYYLQSYSVSILGYSRSTGSLLLSLNSGVNSFSRVAMGTLADFIGRQNTMIASVYLSGLSVFALWYSAPRIRFIAFVVLYGIYSGGYNALLPTSITDIYGVENYSNVNGFIYFIRGIGSLFGAPLAGVIVGSHKRGGEVSSGSVNSALQEKFDNVAVYSGALLVAAGVCVTYVRWLDARDKGRWIWRA